MLNFRNLSIAAPYEPQLKAVWKVWLSRDACARAETIQRWAWRHVHIFTQLCRFRRDRFPSSTVYCLSSNWIPTGTVVCNGVCSIATYFTQLPLTCNSVTCYARFALDAHTKKEQVYPRGLHRKDAPRLRWTPVCCFICKHKVDGMEIAGDWTALLVAHA